MNCKPGDLAIAIRGDMSAGRVVRCLRLMKKGDFVPTKCGRRIGLSEDADVWAVEGFIFFTATNGELVEAAMAQDAQLRPIRDPGEDAQDETLSWLPVPSREGVEA